MLGSAFQEQYAQEQYAQEQYAQGSAFQEQYAQDGPGNGVHTNDALPINPAPLVGGQNWNDNVATIRKI